MGYFFSPDDRVERMATLLERCGGVGLTDIERLQQDVYMPSAVALRDLFVSRTEALGVAAAATVKDREVIDLLRRWDGHYRADSSGAASFEVFRHAFTQTFYAYNFGAQDWAAWANVSRIQSLMVEDIERTDAGNLARCLEQALGKAGEGIDAHTNWGDLHRLGLRHALGALPLAGGRFRFGDHPVGGSDDTVMKTAHSGTRKRHTVNYGSNARHISDLSHPDRNHFVLLGGQDGWIGSSTFLDQVPLWLEGEYVQLPLQIETVRAAFLHKTELVP